MGIAALLGACLGSFINCLGWRLVHGESVLAGRSHCTHCDHVLAPLDLVPIVSWLVLRGRCRHCGVRISARYVIVEIIMAASFVVLLAVHGFGVATLVYMVLACLLMGVALVDLDTFTIPNGFIVAGVVLWLASVWFMRVPPADIFGIGSLFASLVGRGWPAVALDGIAGAVVVGGGILVFSMVFDAIVKRSSLGGGDVKLLFMTGLFLGLAGSLFNVLLACVLGLALAFVRGVSPSVTPSEAVAEDEEPESFRTKAIPFGPAIAAATMLALVVGPSVLTWYTGLL